METDLDFEPHAAARGSLYTRLKRYQPPNDNDNDDTVRFLKTFFKFLPVEGQVNLTEGANGCEDDPSLRQLAKQLETALLRPMIATGGKMPVLDLRAECMQRDNHRCILTKYWDFKYHDQPPGSPTTSLEAAHIFPFAMGTFLEDERFKNAAV